MFKDHRWSCLYEQAGIAQGKRQATNQKKSLLGLTASKSKIVICNNNKCHLGKETSAQKLKYFNLTHFSAFFMWLPIKFKEKKKEKRKYLSVIA